MSDIEARVGALEAWRESFRAVIDVHRKRIDALERGAAGAAVPASSTLFNMLDASIAGLACLLAKEEEEQANLCGQLESFAATIIHECLKRPAAGAAKARYSTKAIESTEATKVMDGGREMCRSVIGTIQQNRDDANKVAAALEAMEGT